MNRFNMSKGELLKCKTFTLSKIQEIENSNPNILYDVVSYKMLRRLYSNLYEIEGLLDG